MVPHAPARRHRARGHPWSASRLVGCIDCHAARRRGAVGPDRRARPVLRVLPCIHLRDRRLFRCPADGGVRGGGRTRQAWAAGACRCRRSSRRTRATRRHASSRCPSSGVDHMKFLPCTSATTPCTRAAERRRVTASSVCIDCRRAHRERRGRGQSWVRIDAPGQFCATCHAYRLRTSIGRRQFGCRHNSIGT